MGPTWFVRGGQILGAIGVVVMGVLWALGVLH